MVVATVVHGSCASPVRMTRQATTIRSSRRLATLPTMTIMTSMPPISPSTTPVTVRVATQALATWLQTALALPQPASNVRVEPARPAPWAEKAGGHGGGHRMRAASDAEGMPAPAATNEEPGASSPSVPMQPEHWSVNFGAPRMQIQAEYWVGNHAVSVRRTDNGVVATLTNLHKGIGMPVAWILLVDTLAGSLILLSLSGLALWVLTRRKRTVGFAIFGTALAVTAGLAIAHL